MKIFTYILLLFIFSTLKAQYTNIPNSSFEGLLISRGLDDVYDGRVLTANIENETHFYMVEEFISDITGIEDFKSLEELDIRINSISNVDLSQMTNLRIFKANRNSFVNLDFSNNPNLEIIKCQSQFNSNNDYVLTNIDVSQCNNLVHLDLWNNAAVPTIDISNSPNLIFLNVAGSDFSFLDVSNNLLLSFLDIENTNISTIDISNNVYLKHFNMGILDISEIDISNNALLDFINLSNTNINFLDISNNVELDTLYLVNTQVNILDLTNNLHLKVLLCQNNYIESLDLRNCPELITLNASYNDLNSFSVRNGTNEIIRDMDVRGNDNLDCVEVDDAYAATNNLYPYNQASWHINTDAYYSDDCGLPSVIEDNEITDVFSIYPNPITNKFYIENTNDYTINSIKIYNQFGALVKSTNSTIIDISKFSKGVYFVTITTTNNLKFTKEIVKN